MTPLATPVSQISAFQAADQSIHPLVDETHGEFVVRQLPGENQATLIGSQMLQGYLDKVDIPALVHVLPEVYLQSTHWMLRVNANLIAETRYLTHEKHLLRNFSMINSDDSLKLDDTRIWILGTNYAGGNYWHWHAQCLPAIVHALETIPVCDFQRISVLTGPLVSWQREGLSALGLAPEQITEVPHGRTVHINSLRYSDLLSSRQVFGKNHARRRTRTLLLQASRTLPGVQGKSASRIYISRADSKKRPLLNDLEISREVERMGFVSITNTGMSLLEQISLYETADVVVAPHGAGSTNLFFMQTGSSFVEFQQASHVNAGPLSLGKSSGISPYAEVFPDDGRGQATEGWKANVRRAVSSIHMALEH